MEPVLIVIGIILVAGVIALIMMQLRAQKSGADTTPLDGLTRELRDQNAALLRFTQEQSSALRQELAAALKIHRIRSLTVNLNK